MTVMTNPATVAPSTGGVELPLSRRRVDLFSQEQARTQYQGGSLVGDCAVRIEYSSDDGSSWSELVAPGPTVNGSNYVVISDWGALPAAALGEILIRATAVGTAALGITIQYVEMQWRSGSG